jgi:hypothetical protein
LFSDNSLSSAQCAFLRGVATARTKGMTLEQVAALPREELVLLQSFLVEAANIALKTMEYAYPKLARIDHVGDVPTVNVDNRVVVELKIGAPRHASTLVEASPSSMEQSSIAPETAVTRRRET